MSTLNYSAESGRTSGFVANAITRSPSTHWHGFAYDYQKSDVLRQRISGERERYFARTAEGNRTGLRGRPAVSVNR